MCRVVVIAWVVAAAGLSPSLARADHIPGVAKPIIVEPFTLDIAGPTPTFALATGGHGWLADRYYVAARVRALNPHVRLDTDGNGREDFNGFEHGPHVELQLEFGVPVLREVNWSLSSWRGTLRTGDGRYTTTHDWIVIHDLSAVTGAVAALSLDAPAVGVAVGLRYGRRSFGPKAWLFRESSVQARAVVFASRDRVQLGADAELMWGPGRLGVIGLFAEYIPQMIDFEPTPGEDDLRLNSFTPIPGRHTVRIGVRIRAQLPR